MVRSRAMKIAKPRVPKFSQYNIQQSMIPTVDTLEELWLTQLSLHFPQSQQPWSGDISLQECQLAELVREASHFFELTTMSSLSLSTYHELDRIYQKVLGLWSRWLQRLANHKRVPSMTFLE